ncbi:CPBP family intramembrane glutamic endopeptidase [Phycisphaera mikurensis]|uniref:CAAX prenyl protease 2/Lysostaphin resistance protein A-like domain-containing protein n=1 Tax=Phycisphaera mikurensis (strain NBRC 102666 / KCTC 22515 / FYK2301M01) TaxID=1142394 RepID=I0IGD5_PHYMF|nr:type II CAAX endopeptidase family protein [Phycisphaera mikurensis]MBB6440299.1 hypothetical protein [Phycisphaera mikurensis]BAM04323.1 hypothetical protein PSMK_21640 [Phycisphaera mikurensis NBRC 102666]
MENDRRAALLFLLATVPLPTVGVTLSLVLFPEAWWSKAVFALAKAWLVAAPLAWLWLVEERRPRIPPFSWRGMGAANATGAVIFVAIGLAWIGFGRERVDAPAMAALMREAGLRNGWSFLAAAAYWCTVNSLIEEYFWRWWVYERLRAFAPAAAAVLVCGVLFTTHHVVVLDAYLPWELTLLGSLGVLIGGITWSWIYARYGNLYAAYVSHVWADVVIFWIGWEVLRGQVAPANA